MNSRKCTLARSPEAATRMGNVGRSKAGTIHCAVDLMLEFVGAEHLIEAAGPRANRAGSASKHSELIAEIDHSLILLVRTREPDLFQLVRDLGAMQPEFASNSQLLLDVIIEVDANYEESVNRLSQALGHIRFQEGESYVPRCRTALKWYSATP